MEPVYFELKGARFPIKLTYANAIGTLPEKFGINLLKIFVSNEEASKVMNNLLLDDTETLRLMWHYLEEKASFTYDEFIEIVQPKNVSEFRERFWDAVVAFSDPLKQGLLREIWDTMKRDLKKATLDNASSDSNPEQ